MAAAVAKTDPVVVVAEAPDAPALTSRKYGNARKAEAPFPCPISAPSSTKAAFPVRRRTISHPNATVTKPSGRLHHEDGLT